ncbi:MAG: hypothetical protein R2795_15460 [Saprospiraceae bacterium]
MIGNHPFEDVLTLSPYPLVATLGSPADPSGCFLVLAAGSLALLFYVFGSVINHPRLSPTVGEALSWCCGLVAFLFVLKIMDITTHHLGWRALGFGTTGASSGILKGATGYFTADCQLRPIVDGRLGLGGRGIF